MKFLFVGEKRSNRAIQMGVTWEDGRLAAKTLFKALIHCGINPNEQIFINIFEDKKAIHKIKKFSEKYVVVGMGRKVQQELTKNNIEHIKIVHPASRGKIRKTELYNEHIRSQLCCIM